MAQEAPAKPGSLSEQTQEVERVTIDWCLCYTIELFSATSTAESATLSQHRVFKNFFIIILSMNLTKFLN